MSTAVEVRSWQTERQRRMSRQMEHRAQMRVQERAERARQREAAEAIATEAKRTLDGRLLLVAEALERTKRHASGKGWIPTAAAPCIRPVARPRRDERPVEPRAVRRARLAWERGWLRTIGAAGRKVRRARSVLRKAGVLA